MPALLLCYFGQGALVLSRPETATHPFFAMVPKGPATVGLVVLSSVATIIASQALISGAFSLTRQAQQLGYFPRVTIVHTDAQTQGQIYIPEINWILAAGCFLLVLGFQKSERLAAAYGIAVTGTMILTSVVFFVVMRRTWRWPLGACLAVLALFLAVDVPFFAANTAKIADGGWVPVLIGFGFVVAMLIWNRGRTLVTAELLQRSEPLEPGLERMVARAAARVPGAAVFLASNVTHVPPVLTHVVERTRTLHELVFILTVEIEPRPTVAAAERYELTELEPGIKRLLVRYGFMEEPDIPAVLAAAAAKHELEVELSEVTYFLGREAVLGHETGKMGRLSEGIFAFLNRNAVAADAVFGIPPKQAVEVGLQVDL
jgi:KUP system potassium uptake protein